MPAFLGVLVSWRFGLFRRGLPALLCLLSVLAFGQDAPHLRVWHLGRVADPPRDDAPLPVGSLQKPFVVKAWALSHPGQAPPRVLCTPASCCWLRAGHGEIGLAKALSVSCNTYFLKLAEETPVQVLQETLSREGFQGTLSGPDTAIGLPGAEPLVIRPSRLLGAYARLVREPWTEGEAVRQHVLAGLRTAARSGTAAGLGRDGCWAKTGTIPSLDGDPSRTRGLVLVLEDAGPGTLALIDPGTGHDAAAALNHQLRLAGTEEAAVVRVRLFDLLPSKAWRVRNLGTGSIPARKGFLGPGATLDMEPGGWVGPGLLEISVPGTGLTRRLEGRLAVTRDRNGAKHLVSTLTTREYASGVIAAECPAASVERRLQLGAAILRFLAHGPRHGDTDVCDNTHCAWFVGRGPRMVWTTPLRAIRAPSGQDGTPSAIGDAEWNAMVALSERPGPSQWSADCGGHPLSEHALWGNGNREVFPCSRHTAGPAHPWQRLWKQADLRKAFGTPVERLELRHPEGVWTLSVSGPEGTRDYRFDDAHRILARVLGWDALPSPADDIQSLPEGYRATGVGQGHRVGLCLQE